MKLELLLKAAPFSGIRVKPFDGTTKYLSTGDLQDDSLNFVDVTFKDRPSRADIMVQEGDVLFARMKGTKKVLRINKEIANTIVSTGFAVVRPAAGCDPSYLATFLNTDYFERQKEKYCSGSIQPAITNGGIEKLEVPLPSINDQTRIAYLISKVEGLVGQRKQHLKQLDDLLKSVFLDMFGDPVRNHKGWDYSEFGTIQSGMRNGLSPSKAGTYKGTVYTLSAITGDSFQEIYKEDTFSQIHQKYFPLISDFLICRGNGNIKLVGKGYFFPCDSKNIIFPDTMIAVSIRPDAVNRHFLEALWKTKFIRQQIENNARTTNGAHKINQGVIEKIKIILPPSHMQEQFATIVEKVRALKSRYKQSLYDLETLYGSLCQRAFKGELDLSKVPLIASKHLISDDVEITVDHIQTLKSSEKVIKKLNTFNSQHAVLLESLNSMPALKIINSPVFKAARELAEQAALWRTPLDQFKNMGSVAKATAAIATASNIPGVNNAALLAQQIASAVPKMDIGWLKDQQAIINAATGPFYEMQQAIAALKLSVPEYGPREFEHAIPALQAAVPNNPETASRLALAIQQDDDENEPRYIFTRDNILEVLSGDTPLSVTDLMSKLAELEIITPQGYSRIKSLLFSLLAEEQIQQQYNEEENAIAFRKCT